MVPTVGFPLQQIVCTGVDISVVDFLL
jgi:hypothetical protein